nr:Dihydrofolate reductase [uncultured bacterium]AIA16834.1 Dihydrofolate reductase [uncultured bacterium]
MWAMGRNRVIGAGGDIPWRLPADWAYLKATTMGHPILMGRKTYESIGKPLPGRTNIILTKNANFAPEGCVIVHSIEDAIKRYGSDDELFVLGGAEIYKLALPCADRLYATQIDHEFAGDTYFPVIDLSQWEVVSRRPGTRDEKNPYDYEFIVFWRKKEVSE